MNSGGQPHRIVIVGGGAGGLELAVALGDRLGRRGRAEVLLVDGYLTHLWKPLIHEVAAGTLDSHADAIEFLAQARVHGFGFRLGRMEGLDRHRRTIRLGAVVDDGLAVTPARELAYDTLVIAVGSTVSDFGVPDVAAHCTLLDNARSAEAFHKVFLAEHLHAQAGGGVPGSELPAIGIVGAGATGVELAAELHAASRQLVAYGLDRAASARGIRLALIETADRVLPGLPERVSRATEARLRELGVELYLGEPVTEVCAEGFRTQSGRFVPCRLKVWAAGIRAPDFLASLDGLEVNDKNQLKVRPTLQTTGSDDIFAIGDCAECPWPGHDGPVPPRAQAAHQQARHLAKALTRRLDGKPLPGFVYKDRGSLIALSRYATVGNVMGNLFGDVTFEGWLARLAYRSLYRMHQRAVFGWLRTLLVMLADSLRRRAGPALKLH